MSATCLGLPRHKWPTIGVPISLLWHGRSNPGSTSIRSLVMVSRMGIFLIDQGLGARGRTRRRATVVRRMVLSKGKRENRWLFWWSGTRAWVTLDHSLGSKEVLDLVPQLEHVAVLLEGHQIQRHPWWRKGKKKRGAPSASQDAWRRSPSIRDGDEHRWNRNLVHLVVHHISVGRQRDENLASIKWTVGDKPFDGSCTCSSPTWRARHPLLLALRCAWEQKGVEQETLEQEA